MLKSFHADIANKYALAGDAALIVGGSLFIAAAAQVAVRLPFSPVPVTGQTLAVLLVGALLGSRRGAMSVLAYLLEGAVGMPVLAGGAGGIAYMLGPTGGYLLGFVLAAFVVGRMAEWGWTRTATTTALAMLIGNAVIYALGLPWLALYVGRQAMAVGLLPFLAGDLLKLSIAVVLLPSGRRLLRTPVLKS